MRCAAAAAGGTAVARFGARETTGFRLKTMGRHLRRAVRTLLTLALAACLIVPFDPVRTAASLADGSLAWLDARADDGDGGDGGDGDGGGAAGGDGGAGHQRDAVTADGAAFNEVVALGLRPRDLAALRARGYTVLDQRSNAQLGGTVTRLAMPLLTTFSGAAQEIAALNPAAIVDRNHLYRPSGGDGCAGGCAALELVGWPRHGERSSCTRSVTLGMIDTGVDRTHPALRGQPVETVEVRGAGRAPSDPRHGTAVAALLIGARGSSAPGLLPGTRLLAVDAFHRSRLGLQRMDAFDLVAALDTLSRRGVRVINLSFAGADNRLLAESVRRAAARRVILVAAVGNDGPTATPRFPAAYAEVIAVTAVGAGGEAYRQAGRGPHVELAAPGVDALVADARDPANRRALSGTSYAAPYVTAAAGVLAARSPSSVHAVRARLLATASDLGAAGVDPVFGHGLLQAGPLCSVRR